MKFSFVRPTLRTRGAVVADVLKRRRLSPIAVAHAGGTTGAIGRAKKAGRLLRRRRQVLNIPAPRRLSRHRNVQVGLGTENEIDVIAVIADGRK